MKNSIIILFCFIIFSCEFDQKSRNKPDLPSLMILEDGQAIFFEVQEINEDFIRIKQFESDVIEKIYYTEIDTIYHPNNPTDKENIINQIRIIKESRAGKTI